jgi:hypothetical protein
MTEVTEARLEDIEALFVQTAEHLTSDGNGQITLEGVSPSTLYFADRPQREVGHMATGRFIDLWARATTASRPTRPTQSCRSPSRLTGRLRRWWSRSTTHVRTGIHLVTR